MTTIPRTDSELDELFSEIANEKGSTHRISTAKQPNRALDHDDDKYLAKLDTHIKLYVDVLLEATEYFYQTSQDEPQAEKENTVFPKAT
jgi:hypothetical protein